MLVAFTQDRDGHGQRFVDCLARVAAGEIPGWAPRGLSVLRDGILQSKAGAALLGKAGKHATTRNLATTLKLCELANAAGKARKNKH